MAALVLATIAACSPGDGGGEQDAPAATQPARTAPPSAPPVNDVTDELEVPVPDPVWDEAARHAAVEAAQRVMESFARPELDEETWWSELAPLLSLTAQGDYSFVDPVAVPARAVTGPAVLVDEPSVFLAWVQVPTDAGQYEVLLSRTGDGAPWLAERITPPQEPDR